jgi:hypothetical protein
MTLTFSNCTKLQAWNLVWVPGIPWTQQSANIRILCYINNNLLASVITCVAWRDIHWRLHPVAIKRLNLKDFKTNLNKYYKMLHWQNVADSFSFKKINTCFNILLVELFKFDVTIAPICLQQKIIGAGQRMGTNMYIIFSRKMVLNTYVHVTRYLFYWVCHSNCSW